jgi:short-subunit dehydrogenase
MPAAAADAARRALAAEGRVDVLVNNAGQGLAGSFAAADPARIRTLVEVNLAAPLLLTRALLPAMLERGGGHVVNVASIVGHTGRGGEAAYAATKAGLVVFSESLREELRGTPVSVSLVTPGVIDTPFFARRGAAYERRWPRPIAAERVAAAVVAAVRDDRAEVFVPRWMALPAALRGGLPGVYRSLAARFG